MTYTIVRNDGTTIEIDESEFDADRPVGPPPPVPLSLSTVASADLSVEEGELIGMDRAMGLEMAFMIDEQTSWLFFTQPQPDLDYIVTPADGVTKYEDYLEVVKPSASRIQVLVQRLQ
jgi:hypothetical protein